MKCLYRDHLRHSARTTVSKDVDGSILVGTANEGMPRSLGMASKALRTVALPSLQKTWATSSSDLANAGRFTKCRTPSNWISLERHYSGHLNAVKRPGGLFFESPFQEL